MSREFRTCVATMRAWRLEGHKTSQRVLDWLSANEHLSGATRVVVTPTEVLIEDPAQVRPKLVESREDFVKRLNRSEPDASEAELIAARAIDAAVEDAMRAHETARYFGV